MDKIKIEKYEVNDENIRDIAKLIGEYFTKYNFGDNMLITTEEIPYRTQIIIRKNESKYMNNQERKILSVRYAHDDVSNDHWIRIVLDNCEDIYIYPTRCDILFLEDRMIIEYLDSRTRDNNGVIKDLPIAEVKTKLNYDNYKEELKDIHNSIKDRLDAVYTKIMKDPNYNEDDHYKITECLGDIITSFQDLPKIIEECKKFDDEKDALDKAVDYHDIPLGELNEFRKRILRGRLERLENIINSISDKPTFKDKIDIDKEIEENCKIEDVNEMDCLIKQLINVGAVDPLKEIREIYDNALKCDKCRNEK